MSDAVGLVNKVHHKVYHEVYHGMGTMFYNNWMYDIKQAECMFFMSDLIEDFLLWPVGVLLHLKD